MVSNGSEVSRPEMRNWPPYLCLYFATNGAIYYIPSGDENDSFLAFETV